MKDWEYADLQQYYKNLTNGNAYPFSAEELAENIAKIEKEQMIEASDKLESAILNIRDHYNSNKVKKMCNELCETLGEL